MNAPVSRTEYPPIPSVSLLVAPETPSWTQLRSTGHSACSGLVGVGVEAGGWGTNGAFRAVGSGCLRTDNGLILPFLKQTAVCSLPCLQEQRAVEADTKVSVVRMEGTFPEVDTGG